MPGDVHVPALAETERARGVHILPQSQGDISCGSAVSVAVDADIVAERIVAAQNHFAAGGALGVHDDIVPGRKCGFQGEGGAIHGAEPVGLPFGQGDAARIPGVCCRAQGQPGVRPHIQPRVPNLVEQDESFGAWLNPGQVVMAVDNHAVAVGQIDHGIAQRARCVVQLDP